MLHFCLQAETLQLEIDQLKEQNEELSLDLQILQEEVNTAGKFTKMCIPRNIFFF